MVACVCVGIALASGAGDGLFVYCVLAVLRSECVVERACVYFIYIFTCVFYGIL